MLSKTFLESFLNILEKIIPLINVLISALVSCIVAKINARNEIKKAMMTSEHENDLAIRKNFSELMFALERYCNFSCGGNHIDAIKANADFLSVAPDCCRPILIKIAEALNTDSERSVKKLSKELFDTYLKYIENTDNNPGKK